VEPPSLVPLMLLRSTMALALYGSSMVASVSTARGGLPPLMRGTPLFTCQPPLSPLMILMPGSGACLKASLSHGSGGSSIVKRAV
jgi:hypothetical protein